VPWIVYTDLRASWRWNDHIQLYGAIDNAFNTPPPNLATTGGGGPDCRIYDCIGRSTVWVSASTTELKHKA
jgi:hypothetical protein